MYDSHYHGCHENFNIFVKTILTKKLWSVKPKISLCVLSQFQEDLFSPIMSLKKFQAHKQIGLSKNQLIKKLFPFLCLRFFLCLGSFHVRLEVIFSYNDHQYCYKGSLKDRLGALNIGLNFLLDSA